MFPFSLRFRTEIERTNDYDWFSHYKMKLFCPLPYIYLNYIRKEIF